MLDVIVVTAFGRQSWLVKKLIEKNLQFMVLDLTPYFKTGDKSFTVPFGAVFSEGDKSGEEILKCGYIFSQQYQGWSAITDRGVIETNGLIKGFQKSLRQELAEKILAHQVSTYDYPFGVLAQKKGTAVSQQWVTYEMPTTSEPHTVTAFPGEPLELRVREGGQIIKHKDSVYKAPYLINLLDPYMIQELKAKSVECEELVAARPLLPLYVWQPFLIKSSETEHLSQLPKQTVIVPRTDKPWIEDHFLVVNREASSQEFVVWCKAIFDLKNNSQYTANLRLRVKSQIDTTFHLKLSTIQDLFVSHDQGLSPYPVYDQQDIQLYKKWYDRGVFYCGFEVCDSFSLDEQIRVQQLCINGLLQEIERDRQIHT